MVREMVVQDSSEVKEMKELILTVGLPRSGKTTWALEQGYPIVNPDGIRLAIHGKQFVALAEPLVWVIAKYMVRALFNAGHDVVILDATNTTSKRRDAWDSNHWQTNIHVIPTPKSICLERTLNPDLFSIIEKMAEDWDVDGYEVNA